MCILILFERRGTCSVRGSLGSLLKVQSWRAWGVAYEVSKIERLNQVRHMQDTHPTCCTIAQTFCGVILEKEIMMPGSKGAKEETNS